jgi:hypothetical protein
MDASDPYPLWLRAPQASQDCACAVGGAKFSNSLSHSIDELWNEFRSDSTYMQSSLRIGTVVVAWETSNPPMGKGRNFRCGSHWESRTSGGGWVAGC